MKILLTGYSGFLGKAIKEALSEYEIVSIGRSQTADIVADLTMDLPLLPECDIVVHAAGKAHLVPKTLQEEQEFYTVNVQGTLNLLKALEKVPARPASFVFISSVAVYGMETGRLITEEAPLLATDAYGRTKIQAEELIQHWCDKHEVRCAILRLPLVAGPNPPGNLKTMIGGITKGYYFNIAGGRARKSIVLANDVAAIIPRVAEIGGIYNLTDGYHPSFAEIASYISVKLAKNEPLNMPAWMSKVLARTGDVIGRKFPLNSNKLSKIVSDLTFDDSRARRMLDWNPKEVLKEFLLS